MEIIPVIEIQNNTCVSLRRGNMDDAMMWHVDPVEKAREFARDGASWMQVTDFDALVGDHKNVDLVESIIRGAGIPVQLGGGLHSEEKINYWMDRGVGRIIIGSAAVKWPDFVKDMAKKYPDQIVLSIDVFKDKVMTNGWRDESAFTPSEFLKGFQGTPFAAVMCTDIDTDIGDGDGAAGMISGLARDTDTPVIASGIVRTLDDVSRLNYAGNISALTVGRALFNKTVDLAEAIETVKPQSEPIAEFI
jgi:phosphoribosylformimino-5-aminoimidazole carboxamide ribotide isomerase